MGAGANNSKQVQGVALALRSLSLEDCCFYAGLALYLLWKFIQGTMIAPPSGSSLNTALHFGSLGLIVLSCVGHIKLDTNFYMAFVLGAVGLLVKLCADNFTYIDLAVILYAAHRFNYRGVAKFSLVILGLACLITVMCSQVGVIQDYPFTRGSTIRHGLGFLWCTTPSHYYLNLVLLYVYLRPQIKVPELLVLLLGDIAIYLATDSRNSFLMVILVLLFVALRRKFNKLASARVIAFTRKCAGWSFVLLTAICFALPLMYNAESGLWRKVNSVSSNRLAQTQASLYKYGVLPFGQDIEFVGNGIVITDSGLVSDKDSNPDGDANMIDSSFVRLFVMDGYVVALMVLGGLTISALSITKHESPLLWMIILIIGIHSVLDPQLLSLQCSSFLFLFWDYAVLELENCRRWLSPRGRVMNAFSPTLKTGGPTSLSWLAPGPSGAASSAAPAGRASMLNSRYNI